MTTADAPFNPEVTLTLPCNGRFCARPFEAQGASKKKEPYCIVRVLGVDSKSIVVYASLFKATQRIKFGEPWKFHLDGLWVYVTPVGTKPCHDNSIAVALKIVCQEGLEIVELAERDSKPAGMRAPSRVRKS